jgi:hypothetical protein
MHTYILTYIHKVLDVLCANWIRSANAPFENSPRRELIMGLVLLSARECVVHAALLPGTGRQGDPSFRVTAELPALACDMSNAGCRSNVLRAPDCQVDCKRPGHPRKLISHSSFKQSSRHPPVHVPGCILLAARPACNDQTSPSEFVSKPFC